MASAVPWRHDYSLSGQPLELLGAQRVDEADCNLWDSGSRVLDDATQRIGSTWHLMTFSSSLLWIDILTRDSCNSYIFGAEISAVTWPRLPTVDFAAVYSHLLTPRHYFVTYKSRRECLFRGVVIHLVSTASSPLLFRDGKVGESFIQEDVDDTYEFGQVLYLATSWFSRFCKLSHMNNTSIR